MYWYFFSYYLKATLSINLYVFFSNIKKIITISYLITLATICLTDIFWSPNFYITTAIKLANWVSDVLTSSKILYNILNVIPTIFGLGSFIIFIIFGNIILDDPSNYGLFLLTWIL